MLSETGRNVLVVFAHPDDESYGPGATLAGLAAAGLRLTLLTFTRGELSTLGVAEAGGPEALAAIREQELKQAVGELGIVQLRQFCYPDGGLSQVDPTELEGLVGTALDELQPLLVVTFGSGGISGHPDHITASRVAVSATAAYAARRAIAPPPVYGWAMPARIAAILKERLGRDYAAGPDDRVVAVPVRPGDVEAQWRAVRHHRSQHQPPPWPFEVRLEVQAGHEFLERLLPEGALEPEPILALLGHDQEA